MISDEFYMLRAIELAKNGKGSVSPNPLVGCVIVYRDSIIGEGWHQKYGEAHAEVNAVNSVAEPSLLEDAVVYVNLEPCAHTGKTPPCADMLIKHQVKRVVIANEDPNPLVAGKGINKLRQAGIDVTTGVLENEGYELNKRFFTFFNLKRPYIILKWAQTSDGFIARENYDSKWISNELSRKLVHKWRGEEDSILVGYRTASHDNPQLTVRDWTGKNPIRVVIDPKLNLNTSLHLFDESVTTICYNTVKQDISPGVEFVRIEEQNMLNHILKDLNSRRIQSLLVEGGAQTLNNFMSTGFWDEARVFISEQRFGKGVLAPQVDGEVSLTDTIGSDKLNIIVRRS